MRICDLYWLAGLFEADGCLKSLGKYGIGIEIALTDLDVLEKCKRLFGGNIYGPYDKNNGKGHNIKPIYSWNIQKRKDAFGMLMTLYPLLGNRRQERARFFITRYRDAPLAKKDRKTCSKGHEYSEVNTRIYRGRRYCKTCDKGGGVSV